MGKFREKMNRFMMRRNGADNLSQTTVFTGLGFTVLSIILNLFQNNVCSVISSIFSTIGLILLIISLFRMFSSNKEKRQEENRRYLMKTQQLKTEMHRAKVRFQRRKEFKYFKCPNCHGWMRCNWGMGIHTETCKRCGNSFTQKS